MPQSASFQRFTFRVVLLKVSPLVVRLVSVPDDLFLDELHEVLQLTFGRESHLFYSFRIHGQEISRRRHLRSRRLHEFHLRRREKFSIPTTCWICGNGKYG